MTRAIVAVAVLVASATASADAQYFGRNKIQYDRFAFRVTKTPHFDVYFYPAEEPAARIAAAMAERWYDRLSKALDHTFARRQPIVLYASHGHFAQTTILPGSIPDGVGGFTDHLAGRVVLPFAAGLGETNHVLGHEIVHAFQRDILRRRGRSLAMLPLWFSEGMAEYLSVAGLDANTRMWVLDALRTGTMPTIEQLSDPKWFPYRYGQALWWFLAERFGDETIVKALDSRASSMATRLKDATGLDIAALSREWHEALREELDTAPAATDDDHPLALVGVAHHGGRLNVSPRLSPDGRWLVFLSERDGHSVDVFLADAATGSVVRKLLSMAGEAHVDSLQFVDSAGAWDPSGRQFALATVRSGVATLTLFNMPDGVIAAEIPVTAVDELFSPSWSPDGSRIAFTGMKGGVTDLYVLSLGSREVVGLTADPYSDLQPAWSPDGRSIAFSTDRFSTSIDALSFGDYQLATLDVSTHDIRFLAERPGAKAIDPQWAADGSALYFVSDAGGVSNVHRLDMATGRLNQVTHVATGVTGVTALSPSISLGAGGSRLALSTYARGSYEISIVSTDIPVPSASTAALQARPTVSPVAVAPPDRDLSSRREVPGSVAYVPRLSLTELGSPYLSAGGGAFGSFLRAGMSIGISDMLGQQDVTAAIQVGKETTDNAVAVSYANRRSRWNWGLSAARIPALVGSSDVLAPSLSAGQDVLIRQTSTVQQIHRQAAATASYPFSHALRLEATAGVDATAFDVRSATTVYSSDTRQQIGDEQVRHTSAPGAVMLQTGAALVYDTSVSGATSPVLGRRYRFAFAPAFGDLRVITTAADFRTYTMAVGSATIATRLEGIARTGPDANDERLLPLVWNMRDLVRGVDTDDRTIRTSRFVLANLELRVPIAQAAARSGRLLPMEALAFADCGRFWFPAVEPPTMSDAMGVCSVGIGTRVNAAGFVFEFNGARPFGAPGVNGWRFGVNFLPGF